MTAGSSARLIALEGGEGCGKSTQVERLAARLGAVQTREPGGTAVGAALRGLLLDPATETGAGLSDRAEALLMAADRAQHVAEVIQPSLQEGRHVVTDRYVASSLAYQGYGRGLPLEELRELSTWASGGLMPDLTVLLDVPREVATARVAEDKPDRLEGESAEFHLRVLEGFRQLAATEASPWAVVDGSGSVAEVEAAIWSAVTTHLPDLGP